MPFKLKLKKTRQYNVASKSLFVISVELLDGGVADCTLSVDSTGQECLDNVCQRQAINQPEFFGLRYVNRSQQPRWVQLERPLKLQLDKFASSHQLYLRVMYYVISGTSLITDEVTRYHYFLQLKNDLVEGRIICDCQQAVVLASYSRQAEYGNHDRERHTVEYLKNLLMFPKQMLDGGQIIDSSTLAETGRLEWLTAAVIQHHMSLHNMPQAQAEEGFITTCQQLRGYGQEMFTARDKRDQSEVTIAISLTGIRVLTDTSDTPHFYRWMDITNVINHKRTFSIECQKQGESATFALPSPEDGKYVWRMCVLQHTFYMRHQGALNAAADEHRPKFQQEHGLSESREELDAPAGSASRLEPLTAAHRAHSTSCLELADSRPHPRNRYPIQEHGLSESREELDAPAGSASRLEPRTAAHRAHSTSCLELADSRPHPRNRYPIQEHGLSESREELDAPAGSASRLEPLTAAHRAHSTSCLELADSRPHPRNRYPIQEHGLSESREELDAPAGSASRLEPLTAAHRAHSTSCLELADSRPHPRNRYPIQEHGLSESREELDAPAGSASRLEPLTAAHRAHSTSCLELADSRPHPRNRYPIQEHGLSESREELDAPAGSASRLEPLTAAHRAHSTSCLELADSRPHPRNRALLPSYRPAPDYETAIQQKYQQQRAEAQLRYQNHHAQLLSSSAQPLVYGSHPDIHRVHYPDVTRHTVSVNQGVAATDDYYGLKFVGNYPMAVNPNVQTDHAMHYVNVYKPPPPYPSNGLASNSTPDLAVASQALNYHRGYINSHVSGSSPDLVSTRTALNRQYLGYVNPSHNVVNYPRPNILPATHGTYNNLNSVLEPNPHIIIDPHHISDNIQKVYDERGNIMYSMPMRRISYQRHLVLPQIKHSETQEPIYENVPLPWQNEAKMSMRERAQSLTTTDEISRLNERNSSHPTINDYGNLKPNLNVPNYVPKIDNDCHYVNAQIIKGVRESSVPKDLNVSINTGNDNLGLSIDRISLKNDEKDYDETPYQSLSTHKVSNNNTISKSVDNVTSISIPDIRIQCESDTSHSGALDSALSSSIMNSTYSTSIELEGSKTNISKEKKRRRWGVFMGRGNKNVEIKSATLGRDRAKAGQPANKHRWSTGLPKFQPLPPSITKETLCQLLERKMSDDQLAFAFEQIPKGREGDAEYRTALLPQYAALNGFSADNLPYEDNRVRLHPTPSNPHGYINASNITMTVGSSQRFYVIMQASQAEHSALMWECVWQVGARVVALVGGEPKHLPPPDRPTDLGQFQVVCGRWSRAAWGGSVRVRLRRAARSRSLWHVHYTAWPSAAHAPADVAGFLDFISEVNGLRLACEAEASAEKSLAGNAPIVFSGAKPGPALAAHLLLHVLDTNQELDIPRTIGLLHQQRANLIENVHQYRFLHQVLLQYLKQSRLI